MELEELVEEPYPRLQGGRWIMAVSETRKQERRAFGEVLIRHGIDIKKVEVLDDLIGVLRDKQPVQWRGLGRVQRQKLFLQEKGICCICKMRVGSATFTVEHKINRADGGTDSWENYAISHRECNQRRAVEDNKKREQSHEPIQTSD